MVEFLLGAVCGGIIASALWCVYVQFDERGLVNGVRINWLIREYERMKREKPAPMPDDHWWEY